MDPKKVDLEANLLALLGQPTRLKLLYMLRDGEKCVCKIHPQMREDQSVISRHLMKLTDAGLLNRRKEGVWVYYWIDEPRVFRLLELVDEMLLTIARKQAREVTGAL